MIDLMFAVFYFKKTNVTIKKINIHNCEIYNRENCLDIHIKLDNYSYFLESLKTNLENRYIYIYAD